MRDSIVCSLSFSACPLKRCLAIQSSSLIIDESFQPFNSFIRMNVFVVVVFQCNWFWLHVWRKFLDFAEPLQVETTTTSRPVNEEFLADEASVSMIMAMGFTKAQATLALKATVSSAHRRTFHDAHLNLCCDWWIYSPQLLHLWSWRRSRLFIAFISALDAIHWSCSLNFWLSIILQHASFSHLNGWKVSLSIVHSVGHLLTQLVICSLSWAFVHPDGHLFSQSVICSLSWSFVHSVGHLFTQTVNCSVRRSVQVGHLFTQLGICSLSRSFVQSVGHLFSQLVICSLSWSFVTHLIKMSHMLEISEYKYYT